MLTIYRRHLKDCDHRTDGRDYRRCRCPLWVQGTLGGDTIRKSLDLTSWEAASELVHDWEARGTLSGRVIPVVEAVSKFMNDARARKLTDASLSKLSVVLEKQLVPWCEPRGIKYLSQLEVQALADFRASWKDGAIAATKKLERLRTFFRFAKDRDWMDDNPAKLLKAPKVTAPPTLPFSDDEVARIFWACDNYPRKNTLGQDNRARIKAFVFLLRYSGLRLQDAVTLQRSRLNEGKIFLHTQKTGTAVWVPLPPVASDALTTMRPESEQYFFWSGFGLPRSCMSVWDRSIRRVMKLAKIEGRHNAHRFRDTFAVNLLIEGVPMEDVSILLGHSDIRVTQRHYAPFVKARQVRLEERVKSTWKIPDLPKNVVPFQKKA
jgi:integrase/recombinase XerD